MNPSAVITRHTRNPVITAREIPFPCTRCFNPAAEKFEGKYVLLVRVIGPDRSESLALATSQDGLKFEIAPEPILKPAPEDQGRLNDPRLTRIGDTYYVTYCSDPPSGIRIGILATKDFRSFERIYYSEPDNRNAVLFPEKLGGRYVRLDRPFTRWYAADKSVALAETSVDQLLAFCLNPPKYEHPRRHAPFRPPLSRHA